MVFILSVLFWLFAVPVLIIGGLIAGLLLLIGLPLWLWWIGFVLAAWAVGIAWHKTSRAIEEEAAAP